MWLLFRRPQPGVQRRARFTDAITDDSSLEKADDRNARVGEPNERHLFHDTSLCEIH